MENAEDYHNNNQLQKADTIDILKEFHTKIKWKPDTHKKIMDVGCGDGSVTVEVLKPYIPEPYHMLMGTDISENAIRFANKHYKDNKTEFHVLDIKAKLDNCLKKQFDHVFSFYALHWVQEQKKALSNIYNMLKPDGDCLLVQLAHVPIFDVYKILSRNPTWSQIMHDLDKYISPYQYVDFPDVQLKKLMKKCGFSEVEVEIKDRMCYYKDIEVIKKAVSAVNPFQSRLTPELREQFMNDYIQTVEALNFVDYGNNNENESLSVRCPYTVLVAYGRRK